MGTLGVWRLDDQSDVPRSLQIRHAELDVVLRELEVAGKIKTTEERASSQ